MYLNIGNDMSVRDKHIIGVFDMDTATISSETRRFLRGSEQSGKLRSVAKDIPKSFVLTADTVYLAQPSPTSLRGHLEE
jgi:hypothetical protein